MAGVAPAFQIRSELILRIGETDVPIGHISVPVAVNFVADGKLNLQADVAEVREFVQAVFDRPKGQP